VKASRKDEPKRSERTSWAGWLKEEGVVLDRLNDKCKDREFRTARLSDQNFAVGSGMGGDGRIYPVAKKARRKPACILDQQR
jgi:hypothetical protein